MKHRQRTVTPVEVDPPLDRFGTLLTIDRDAGTVAVGQVVLPEWVRSLATRVEPADPNVVFARVHVAELADEEGRLYHGRSHVSIGEAIRWAIAGRSDAAPAPQQGSQAG